MSEIESLDPDQIESMSVIKGTNLPGEFADKGYEGVITITTKQAAAAQRAAAKSAREGIEAGRDRKSTRLNSSHYQQSRMPSSA